MYAKCKSSIISQAGPPFLAAHYGAWLAYLPDAPRQAPAHHPWRPRCHLGRRRSRGGCDPAGPRRFHRDGKPSGSWADVDIRPGVHGPDSLEAIGCNLIRSRPPRTRHPGIPSPVQWPGYYVKTIAGKLGPGLISADGGSLFAARPGRWDPHLL